MRVLWLMSSAWYDRLALVLMNHYNETPTQKEDKLREATQVCIDGLLDDDTHLSDSIVHVGANRKSIGPHYPVDSLDSRTSSICPLTNGTSRMRSCSNARHVN